MLKKIILLFKIYNNYLIKFYQVLNNNLNKQKIFISKELHKFIKILNKTSGIKAIFYLILIQNKRIKRKVYK